MTWWEIALIVIGALAALFYVVIPVVSWAVVVVVGVVLFILSGLLLGAAAIGEFVARLFRRDR
jgi:hypothetical protein